MVPSAEVRLIKTEDEFRACERIQQQVWGAASASAELLTVIQKSGGVVLGAVVGREIAGFLFALLARRNGRLVHWSHMMAVRKQFRDRGLGLRMKLAHRKLALARSIRSICWTFDPLQARNAQLNLQRLGVDVEDYVANYYGDFPSVIEKGLPSDRLVVNWRLKSRRVERHLNGAGGLRVDGGLPRVNEVRMVRDMPENRRIYWNRDAPRLAVEIPASADVMRARAPQLALRWRMETRRIFQTYFTAGYRVAGFAREGLSRCFYVLERRPA